MRSKSTAVLASLLVGTSLTFAPPAQAQDLGADDVTSLIDRVVAATDSQATASGGFTRTRRMEDLTSGGPVSLYWKVDRYRTDGAASSREVVEPTSRQSRGSFSDWVVFDQTLSWRVYDDSMGWATKADREAFALLGADASDRVSRPFPEGVGSAWWSWSEMASGPLSIVLAQAAPQYGTWEEASRTLTATVYDYEVDDTATLVVTLTPAGAFSTAVYEVGNRQVTWTMTYAAPTIEQPAHNSVIPYRTYLSALQSPHFEEYVRDVVFGAKWRVNAGPAATRARLLALVKFKARESDLVAPIRVRPCRYNIKPGTPLPSENWPQEGVCVSSRDPFTGKTAALSIALVLPTPSTSVLIATRQCLTRPLDSCRISG